MSLLLKQSIKPRRKQCLVLSAMLALLPGCGDNSNSGAGDSESGAGALPMEVQVASVESRSTEATFWAAGVVAPVRRARLGTRQAGSVQEVLVEAGDSVETGQPVLRVDARDLQAALSAARLARQAATTARDTANRNRERFQRLFEQQLIARARLEEVELAAEDARRRLEQAEAELAAIEVNLDYAMLRAPFAGVVSEVLADVGTFVAPGPPLVIFEDRSRLEINAAIGQDTGARLLSGATLQLRAEGVEQRMSGRIQALLPALEQPGVGQRLRLVIDEPPPGLAPGMVVEIKLPAAGSTRGFMVIPDSAVLPRGQLDGVFVVEPDNRGQLRVYLRWISIAPPGDLQVPGRVHVLHGLSVGERVVVGEAVNSLADGQRVRLDGS
ncbi:hypothetical protein CWI75_02150 [Kineobactrum sediminis]|uniref:CusB-like beta-barrel domain-containing protein n=1 Tax=Kineobactrum sediminis TaxID=1905677 RepID=A0A2N5Y6Z6_9GAMM|nr:efflux RND transporter periplasmic adaptor subunit [Kineobactrum sediminis]PLW84173.1 hypothetical protein CWI75_02150 [Kineobactrum sediminis]